VPPIPIRARRTVAARPRWCRGHRCVICRLHGRRGRTGHHHPVRQTGRRADHRGRSQVETPLHSGGYSIVATHALFTDVAFLAKEGLLLGYDVVIDEVLSVVRCVTQELLIGGAKAKGVGIKSWKGLYLEHGFATVDPDTGLVHATEEWEHKQDLPELSKTLFNMANADCLFSVGDNVLLWELPPVLLKAVGSLTVYTFLAEGSLMASFMRRNGIDFILDRDPASERRFKDKARHLINIRDIPNINKLRFSYSDPERLLKIQTSLVEAIRLEQRKIVRDRPKGDIQGY